MQNIVLICITECIIIIKLLFKYSPNIKSFHTSLFQASRLIAAGCRCDCCMEERTCYLIFLTWGRLIGPITPYNNIAGARERYGQTRRALLRKMARSVTRERATRQRRGWEGGATHLYLAQPIRAGLSTVKTSTLTTGDHNRAYLLLSQARLLFLSPTSRCCTKGYLPFCSSIAPLPSPDALSRILSQNFEPTRRNEERKKEKSS